MNTRALTLALVIAFGAMFMVYTYIEDQKSSIVKQYGMESSVVVAAVDINELELIDDSKVTVMNVPQSFQLPGHFKKVEEVENTIAAVPILKGEQITKPRVIYPGSKTGLSRQVSSGKRAMAINVSESTAVGQLLKPGDRVDILAALDYSGGRRDKVSTKTFIQDVLVLSTGLSMTNSIPIIGVRTPEEIKKMNLNTYTRYNTVTLELDPYQVQKLVYLINYTNKLYLSLRNNNDKKIVRIKGTKIFDLLDEDAGEAKQFFSDRYKDTGRNGR